MKQSAAVLFAGQGSQKEEMFDSISANPLTSELLQKLSHRFLLKTGHPILEKWKTLNLSSTEAAQLGLGLFHEVWIQALERQGNRVLLTAGHSFGELAALRAAEALSTEGFESLIRLRIDALTSVTPLETELGMLAVKASLKSLQELPAPLMAEALFANFNSPLQTVLAGARKTLLEIQDHLKRRQTKSLLLSMPYAFHTPFYAGASQAMAQSLSEGGIEFKSWNFSKVISNSTARPFEGRAELFVPQICKQLSSPVKWEDSLNWLYASGVKVFIEVAPVPTLRSFCEETFGNRPWTYLHLTVENFSRASQLLKDEVQETFATAGAEATLMQYLVSSEKMITKAVQTLPPEQGQIVLKDFLVQSEKVMARYLDTFQSSSGSQPQVRSSQFVDSSSNETKSTSAIETTRGPEEVWLLKKLAAETGLQEPEINPQESFENLGVDSITLITVLQNFCEEFSIPQRKMSSLFRASSLRQILDVVTDPGEKASEHNLPSQLNEELAGFPQDLHPMLSFWKTQNSAAVSQGLSREMAWLKAGHASKTEFPQFRIFAEPIIGNGSLKRCEDFWKSAESHSGKGTSLRWVRKWEKMSLSTFEPTHSEAPRRLALLMEDLSTTTPQVLRQSMEDFQTVVVDLFDSPERLESQLKEFQERCILAKNFPLVVLHSFQNEKAEDLFHRHFQLSQALTKLALFGDFSLVLIGNRDPSDWRFGFRAASLKSWVKEHTAVSFATIGINQFSVQSFLTHLIGGNLQGRFAATVELECEVLKNECLSQPAPGGAADESHFDPLVADGVALVTGATKGLGRQIFEEHLASSSPFFWKKINKVLILGSTPKDDKIVKDALMTFASTAAHRGFGISFEYAVCDLSRPNDMIRLLSEITAPILGFFHGAGLTKDQRFRNKDWGTAETVIAIKALSAIHILESTHVEKLRWIIFLSSLSSETGAPGQWDYSGANEVLNCLAQKISTKGITRVKSFGLSVVGDAGLAQGKFSENMEKMGLTTLTSKEARRLFATELLSLQGDPVVFFSPHNTLRYCQSGILPLSPNEARA